MSYDFDLLVIGAGSGGLAAAKRAASYGARVGIVEKSEVGGTCVIRGCVPKKFLVYASRFRDFFGDSRGYGWRLENSSHSWATLRDAVQREVSRLSTLHVSYLEKAGVTLLRGAASFVDPHTVYIKGADEAFRSAQRIIIATGGKPIFPIVPGIELASSSDDMFLLPHLPKRLVIVGGGYIGVEFASIMHGLGCEVSVVIRKDLVLSGFEQELRVLLQQCLQNRGIQFITNRDLVGLNKCDEATVLNLSDGSSLVSDKVMLFATGRYPDTESLELEKAFIQTRPTSHAILINDHFVTSQPHIYAIGDCTDRVTLTPVAIAEGRALSDRLFGGKDTTVSYTNIPTAVFSSPEIGTVGLTEEEAVLTLSAEVVQIYRTTFKPMYNSLSGRDEKVLMKIVVHRTSRQILGVHILGEGAGEMIQCVAIAVQMGATKEDFDRTMALHPSAAEELVTLYTPQN